MRTKSIFITLFCVIGICVGAVFAGPVLGKANVKVGHIKDPAPRKFLTYCYYHSPGGCDSDPYIIRSSSRAVYLLDIKGGMGCSGVVSDQNGASMQTVQPPAYFYYTNLIQTKLGRGMIFVNQTHQDQILDLSSTFPSASNQQFSS